MNEIIENEDDEFNNANDDGFYKYYKWFILFWISIWGKMKLDNLNKELLTEEKVIYWVLHMNWSSKRNKKIIFSPIFIFIDE
jgi:hypothetical protein